MYSTTAKNAMLDALTPDAVSLHAADPGTTGANEVTGGTPAYGRQAATFNAAANGERAMAAAEDFTGPANGAVTHFGVWAGATFLGGGAITGDLAFNAEGAYRLTGATMHLNL